MIKPIDLDYNTAPLNDPEMVDAWAVSIIFSHSIHRNYPGKFSDENKTH